MDTYTPDSSGINSLGGFSYQIRVFVYYMLLLEDKMQIEFETIDDVNIKKIKPNEIDNNDENFISKISGVDSNIAIQVKRTSITENTAQKTLLNWILLETSENVVTKYVLLTDQEYNNKDILFNKSAKELFQCIEKSDKSAKAIITKVKNKFKNNFKEFEKKYNSINEKYEFIAFDNIDKKIDEASAILFRKAGINKVVYYNRIKELLQHVTVEVMEAVNNKKAYIFSFDEFMALIDDICFRIKEEVMRPLYSNFKRMNKVDFKELHIANSREYQQLVACELPQNLIEQHLGFSGYYESLKFSYMETNKICKIKDIEETTYENFENVKFSLQRSGQDNPYNRLEETKKQSNSYADNEQIKFGSSIYLTKEEMEDIQISWEDEDNEKPQTRNRSNSD
ncbi:hypothetical protein [Natronincola ferrireducens]|uniref:Uncharacterized protein n=1 Tax=Natronincola ferrireducens TaxID=393762 RepID=A0A1G9II69_9FIRM|nr:hypothetical protein [Natronincola ferrireducens]SDL24772.1 hypothetical protein SAMN05660472_02877 [Natronincola ferrireducens]